MDAESWSKRRAKSNEAFVKSTCAVNIMADRLCRRFEVVHPAEQ